MPAPSYDDLIPGAGPSRRPPSYDDLLPGGAPAATVQPAEVAAPVGAVDTPSPGISRQVRDFITGEVMGQPAPRGPALDAMFEPIKNPVRDIITGEVLQEPKPHAPWIGTDKEMGAITQIPPVAVASIKNAIAGSALMHAREGEQQARAQLAEQDQSQWDVRDILARRARPARPRVGTGGMGFDEAITRMDLPTEDLKAVLQDATAAGEKAKAWATQTQRELELVTPPNMSLPQKIVLYGAANSAPTLLGVGTGIVTRNPALAMAMMAGSGFQQQSGQTYLEALDHGASHDKAVGSAFRQGLVETLDVIPIGRALANPVTRRSFTDFVKKTLETAGYEGATEGAQQIVQDFDAYVTYDPKMTLGQAWENFIIAAGAGGMMGGFAGAAGAARQPVSMESPQGRATVMADELRRAVRETTPAQAAPTTEAAAATTEQAPPAAAMPTAMAQLVRQQVPPAAAVQQPPVAEPVAPAQQPAPELPPAVATQPAPEQAPAGPMVPPEQAFQRLTEAHPDAGLTMVAPADVPADQRRTAALVTSALDKRVIFVHGDPAIYEGSMFTDAPHTFFVNIDSPRAWRKLLSHETFHTLRQTNPAVYDELHRAVLQVVSTGPAAQRYNERYGATAATRQEEMLADMYGDFMDDPKFLVEVFRASKAPLVERIYQGVRQALNSVYQRLTRGGTSYQTKSLITDLDAARKAFAKAYVAWQAAPHEAAPGGITQADMARMESKPAKRGSVYDSLPAKAPPERLNAFMDELYKGTQAHPFDDRIRLRGNIGIEARPWEGMIHLSSLISFGKKGAGEATRVLDELTKMADEHNVALHGTAKAIDNAGAKGRSLTTKELVAWYERHGFESFAGDVVVYTPKAAAAAPTAHKHSEPGARIPIATDILDTIDHEVKRAGGIKDRAGAADVVDALAEHHEQELLAMMDKVGPDKRPTIMLHKGDLASGTPTVWLLGWSTKEGTDIHDHAGSQVGVHVLRGSVRERVYGVRGNKVARLEARNNPAGVDALQSERDLRAGSTLALADPYIHEVFGHSEGAQRDVTVHAYFPPLTKMTYFTYDEHTGKLKYDGEWDEAQPPSEADKIRKSQPGLRDFTPNVRGVTAGPATRGLTPEQSRVQRAIARPGGVGAPINQRTVLRDKQGELVVGQIRKGDWLKRAREMLPGDEFKQARHWYERLDSMLRPVFGEKTSNIALAWILSQQRASPSQGMMNVMRALDRIRGLPGPKAGLNEQAIIQALREGSVAGGMAAKLADFLDSHTGAATRTVMGGDVRGGQPAAIDVHAYRDTGFVDQAFLRAIADRFGEDAAGKLTEDLTQGDETSYEHASRFYNDLVKYLNDAKIDGGGWTAREAQAVGWAAIQKSIGLAPQMPEDIIGKNVRRVSVGLEPGAGVVAQRMRAPVAENLARDLAGLTGVKILKVEHGRGAYLGTPEGSLQIDVLGSPEAVLDFINAIGYAAKQSSVIATRVLKSGKQMGYDIPSRELTDGAVAQEFFAALHAIPGMTDLAPGYQQSARGLRLLNFAGHWSAKQLAALDAAVQAAAEKTGVQVGDPLHYAVEIVEASNDWQTQPDGQAYQKSLRDRGRAEIAGRLARDYGQRAPPSQGSAAAQARRSQPGERVSPLEGSPQYKAAEQAAEKYFGDYAAARTAYEALPETEHGRILNPDLASELIPEYRAQRELATAVHRSASDFVKAYYAEKLTQETPEKLDGRVIFTAGGPGSGKSTAVRKAVGESADQAEMYYDSMLSRFDSAKARIDAALESGRPVQVIFVDRSPGPAYAGTIQRVLAGYRRIVPIGEHARGHVEARKTLRQLRAAYANDDRVEIIAIDNTDGLEAIKPIASEQIGPWEYTGAYEAALRVTEEANAKGYLTDAQVYAATGRTAEEVRSLVGARAVAEPAQQRGERRASSPGPRPAPSAAAGSGQPATNWNVEQPGVVDALTRSLQDQVVDLKRVQEAIREAGGVIQALNDPYLTEELAKSRYATRIKTFDKKLVEPLLRDLKAKGITAAELDRYLWARHAPEANAQLAKINPGLQNASGMSDAEAAQVIADFRAKGILGKLTALAVHIDAMTAATRKLYVDEKLESQKTVDLWQSIYKNYVPLQREIENPQPGPGQGFKIRGPESKRRMGSQRAVVGITAAVIAKHHNAIIRAEKAHVGRDLIKLAEEFPNPDFWRMDSPPMQRYVNPSSGLVEMRVDPLYKMSPDVFVVKDANASGDIVERVLAFNPLDERALALSRSMQKLDVVEQGAIVRTVGMATRYMANLATQWNPVFWATNLARDVGTMAINLQSTPIKGMAPRVMSRMPGAMAGIASATWGNGSGKYATLWKEAQEEGMPTGWYKNFENILERQKELEKMVKQAGQGNADPRVWARWSAEQISNVNSMIENSTRLAVYSVARDQGLSKREAASIAKNITVNFDRKGNASTAAGAWYMFFNANVQGGFRLAQGLNNSPRARAMVGLMAALGAAMEIINMLIGDHDKDEAGNNPYEILGAYEKQRNWIFMVPKSWGIGDPIKDEKQQIVGRYFKFPLPYGFNIFPTAGRIAAEAVMGRIKPGLYSEKRGPLDLAADFGNVVVDAFSPLGSASTAIQTIAPTIIDPFVQVFENKKWTGTPMVPDRSMQKALPRSSLYFTNNSETAKDLAAWLNRASGGDELTPGWLDLYPGHIEHVFRTLTGGPGTFSMGMFDWGTNITQRALGHDVEPTKTSSIPFVGKFYGEVDERAIEAKFYRIKGQADETYARYRAYKKAGDIDAADKLEADQPALIEFARTIAKSQFRKDQKELREEVKGTRELPVIDRAAAKLEIKRDQSRLYQEALEAYNAAASEGR